MPADRRQRRPTQAAVRREASHGKLSAAPRRLPQLMDTLFVLGQESRLRILQRAAARVPGCAYLCAWAALPAAHPAPPASSSSAATRYPSAYLLLCHRPRSIDLFRSLPAAAAMHS